MHVRRSALVALVVSLGMLSVMRLTQLPAQAQAQTNAPAYFNNFFLTGDHRLYSVQIKGSGNPATHFVTTSIAVAGIPSSASPVAAYLYWATVAGSGNPTAGLTGTQFRNTDLAPVTTVVNGTSPCWSSGGGTGGGSGKTEYLYRADVISLFPVVDGKYAVNGSHALKLVDVGGNGNTVPFTLGATLLVVFRDVKEPYRAIVVYDGGFVMNQGSDVVTQTMKGFYQASDSSPARLSMVVGEGQSGFYDRVLANGKVLGENVFNGPSWEHTDFSFSNSDTSLTPAITDRDRATIRIDHGSSNSYDCLTGGAWVLSTPVVDADKDGLVDKVEDFSLNPNEPATPGTPWMDPAGRPLPDIHRMQASSSQPDLFIEIGAMWAGANTRYGPVGDAATVTDPAGHNHLPNSTVLKLMGDALAAAPTPIKVHFDVGDASAYATTFGHEADNYLLPVGASGGELVNEVACIAPWRANGITPADPTADPRSCQFPDYPGVVGWKFGLQSIRDSWEAKDGRQLPDDKQLACEAAGGGTNCRRRFDLSRKDIFHYVLFGHYTGEPKSPNPCLNPATGTNPDGSCTTHNPDFHIVTKRSGKGDRPGGDAIVTLGAWGNGFRGPDFVQASTMMHETGHHFWLTHSGNPFDLQSAPTGPAPLNPMESNCNANYLSIMSYSLQIDGLTTVENPEAVLDFSRARLGDRF